MPRINEVQITFIKPRDGLIGFASFVVENSFYLAGVGIYSKLDGSGFRLTYPTRKAGNGQANIFHPINKQTAKAIEQAVFTRLNEVLDKSNVGYRGFNDGQYAVSD